MEEDSQPRQRLNSAIGQISHDIEGLVQRHGELQQLLDEADEADRAELAKVRWVNWGGVCG
eukprot:m.69676 g.69676  ORF g.69676 m.69676 type:complete len:61 (-) comp18420_c0_seq2:2147-2329(-)